MLVNQCELFRFYFVFLYFNNKINNNKINNSCLVFLAKFKLQKRLRMKFFKENYVQRGGKNAIYFRSANPYFSQRTRLIFNEPDVISCFERIAPTIAPKLYLFL